MPETSPKTCRAHVFTDAPAPLFLKQFPGMQPELSGWHFTFGYDVPDDIDVLIVYARASYSIQTRLPRERTVFIAAEPDVIHPYSAAFLNQFGIVVSATDKPLVTEQWRSAPCTMWFAGVDFSKSGDALTTDTLKGVDWFRALDCPGKIDRISIVTSSKAFTPYHRKRLQFIEELKSRIPERLEIFGRGFRSVDDKKDALLPYRYHLAIENGDGPDLWTEKLADPLLCWSFPFYAGCSNVGDYIPAGAICEVDLDRPAEMAVRMVELMESGHWKRALPDLTEARNRILDEWNAAQLFLRLARAAYAKGKTREGRKRLIRSERSLWPEPGAKGSIPEWALRRAILAVSPNAELRMAGLIKTVGKRRAARRKRRTSRAEAGR